MDIDGRDWNWKLARAMLPPVLLTLALAAILGFGAALMRSRIARVLPRGMRHLEPAQAAVIGMVLTLFTVGLLHEHERRSDTKAFEQLADSRTLVIAEKLRHLLAAELESLARFYEHSPTITPAEFQQFVAYLTNKTAVQAWEWVPAVAAACPPRLIPSPWCRKRASRKAC